MVEIMAGASLGDVDRLLPRVRLVTGLALMGFVAGHLVNACLGLVSIEAMDVGRIVLLRPWQTLPGQVLLYGSLLTHLVLGLVALLRRVALRPTAIDVAQIAAGLSIPLLLVAHVSATRLARGLAEFHPDYGWILAIYWRFAPNYGLVQVLLVAIVWIHGCIGLFSWLRLQRWWPRVASFVYPPAFALPIVALFGFVHGGDEALMRLEGDDGFKAEVLAESRAGYSVLPTLLSWDYGIGSAYLVLAGLAVAPMGLRRLRERLARPAVATIVYIDGPTVDASLGTTLLDVSRRHGVPHSSICSGHARCGTCRVRIDGPATTLSPPGAEEIVKLAHLASGADIRLACRAVVVRPAHIVIERLVPIVEAEAVAQGHALPAPAYFAQPEPQAANRTEGP